MIGLDKDGMVLLQFVESRVQFVAMNVSNHVGALNGAKGEREGGSLQSLSQMLQYNILLLGWKRRRME
jgi:hypothetical protein